MLRLVSRTARGLRTPLQYARAAGLTAPLFGAAGLTGGIALCGGMSTSAAVVEARQLVIDPFCLRQFSGQGASQIAMDADEVEQLINDYYQQQLATCGGDEAEVLVGGYAPFCKHVFVPNFIPGLRLSCVPITDENRHLLCSDYVARTEKELPVLIRWFPKDVIEAPEAQWLDVILYSREQITKENAATGNSTEQTAPWGIVSIKPQSTNFEQPMTPMTMMRNGLPRREGGSGVALDRAQYEAAVSFWTSHASLQ